MITLFEYLFDFKPFIPDILGILGVLIILVYYFLLQVGKCTANSLGFSIGNFIGAILILVSLWDHWNLASVVIEIAWCLISIYGIFKYGLRTKVYKDLNSLACKKCP